MIDCIRSTEDSSFAKAKPERKTHQNSIENTLGYEGIWLVGSSRDYFKEYDDGVHQGISFSNCCGSGVVAIKK